MEPPPPCPMLRFLPLPYVGYKHKYSDGRLLGIVLSLPATLDDPARQAILQAVGNWERRAKDTLKLQWGSNTIKMVRQLESGMLKSLQNKVWSNPSNTWATATPIALPKHPGGLSSGSITSRTKAWETAKSSVADACTHVGLPKPLSINISLTPFIVGAHPITRFPPFIQNGSNNKKIRRQLIHALLTFETRVVGPLALGAGRFMGLGMMRPLSTRNPQKSGVTQ